MVNSMLCVFHHNKMKKYALQKRFPIMKTVSNMHLTFISLAGIEK